MLNTLYFRNGHLTPEVLTILETDTLTDGERALVLTHLEDCADCMDSYLLSLTEDELLEPPEGMEDRIISAVHEEYGRQKHKKIVAIKFTKLAVAVCLTMVLFAGGVFEFLGKAPRVMLARQTKQEQMEARPDRQQEKESNSILGQIASGINDGFIDFANSLNSFTLLGDGRNERK